MEERYLSRGRTTPLYRSLSIVSIPKCVDIRLKMTTRCSHLSTHYALPQPPLNSQNSYTLHKVTFMLIMHNNNTINTIQFVRIERTRASLRRETHTHTQAHTDAIARSLARRRVEMGCHLNRLNLKTSLGTAGLASICEYARTLFSVTLCPYKTSSTVYQLHWLGICTMAFIRLLCGMRDFQKQNATLSLDFPLHISEIMLIYI